MEREWSGAEDTSGLIPPPWQTGRLSAGAKSISPPIWKKSPRQPPENLRPCPDGSPSHANRACSPDFSSGYSMKLAGRGLGGGGAQNLQSALPTGRRLRITLIQNDLHIACCHLNLYLEMLHLRAHAEKQHRHAAARYSMAETNKRGILSFSATVGITGYWVASESSRPDRDARVVGGNAPGRDRVRIL